MGTVIQSDEENLKQVILQLNTGLALIQSDVQMYGGEIETNIRLDFPMRFNYENSEFVEHSCSNSELEKEAILEIHEFGENQTRLAWETIFEEMDFLADGNHAARPNREAEPAKTVQQSVDKIDYYKIYADSEETDIDDENIYDDWEPTNPDVPTSLPSEPSTEPEEWASEQSTKQTNELTIPPTIPPPSPPSTTTPYLQQQLTTVTQSQQSPIEQNAFASKIQYENVIKISNSFLAYNQLDSVLGSDTTKLGGIYTNNNRILITSEEFKLLKIKFFNRNLRYVRISIFNNNLSTSKTNPVNVQVSAVVCRSKTICGMQQMKTVTVNEVFPGLGTIFHVETNANNPIITLSAQEPFNQQVAISQIEFFGSTTPQKQLVINALDINNEQVKIQINYEITTYKGSVAITLILAGDPKQQVLCARKNPSLADCTYTINMENQTLHSMNNENQLYLKNQENNLILYHDLNSAKSSTDQKTHQNRVKRGLLELIRTGHFYASEYTEKNIQKEVDLRQDSEKLLEQEIISVSNITTHIINDMKEQNSLVSALICQTQTKDDMQIIKVAILAKIHESIAKVERIIDGCLSGFVPLSIKANHLQLICSLYILDKKSCYNMKPSQLRSLFRCSQIKLRKTDDKTELSFKLNAPKVYKQFTGYKVLHVPIFANKSNNIAHSFTTNANYIFVNPNMQMVQFDSCDKIADRIFCDAMQEKTTDYTYCIPAILQKNQENVSKNCVLSSEITTSRCFSASTNEGVLISSKDSMPLHSGTFIASDTVANGVQFIPTKNTPQIIVCNNEIIKLKKSKIKSNYNITIHQMNFNISDIMRSKVIQKYEVQNEHLEHRLNTSIKHLELEDKTAKHLIDENHEKLKKNTINFGYGRSVHSSTFSIWGFIILGIISGSIIICIAYLYCSAKIKCKCLSTTPNEESHNNIINNIPTNSRQDYKNQTLL